MNDASVQMTPRELAVRWKVSLRTLDRWRASRYGPAWITIGRSIRYRLSDVLAFEAGQRSQGCAGHHKSLERPSR